MPSFSNKFIEAPDIKVFIRNEKGLYLAEDQNGLFFTNDRSRALILNYRADEVARQLSDVEDTMGVTLVTDPVPLEEIYEICDQCKDLFTPNMITFDGKRFLCSDCRTGASIRRRRS